MPGSLTPEQKRNRAQALVALRVLAGAIAVSTAFTLVHGTADGYFRLGVGDGRAATGDYVLLDTPIGRMLGAFCLEAIVVFFGALAVRPRYALTPRFLVPSIAAMIIASILIGVLYG